MQWPVGSNSLCHPSKLLDSAVYLILSWPINKRSQSTSHTRLRCWLSIANPICTQFSRIVLYIIVWKKRWSRNQCFSSFFSFCDCSHAYSTNSSPSKPAIVWWEFWDLHQNRRHHLQDTTYEKKMISLFFYGRKIARIAPIWTIFGPKSSQRRDLFFEKNSNEGKNEQAN